MFFKKGKSMESDWINDEYVSKNLKKMTGVFVKKKRQIWHATELAWVTTRLSHAASERYSYVSSTPLYLKSNVSDKVELSSLHKMWIWRRAIH